VKKKENGVRNGDRARAGARVWGARARRPGPPGLDALPCCLTVYVKEQDPERSRVAAAGGHGATGSKDPKTEVI